MILILRIISLSQTLRLCLIYFILQKIRGGGSGKILTTLKMAVFYLVDIEALEQILVFQSCSRILIFHSSRPLIKDLAMIVLRTLRYLKFQVDRASLLLSRMKSRPLI